MLLAFKTPKRARKTAKPGLGAYGKGGRKQRRGEVQRRRDRLPRRLTPPGKTTPPQPGSKDVSLQTFYLIARTPLAALVVLANLLAFFRLQNSKPQPDPKDPPEGLDIVAPPGEAVGAFREVSIMFRQSQYGDPGAAYSDPEFPFFVSNIGPFGDDGGGPGSRLRAGERIQTGIQPPTPGDDYIEQSRKGYNLEISRPGGTDGQMFVGETEGLLVSPDPGGPTGSRWERRITTYGTPTFTGAAEGTPYPSPGRQRGISEGSPYRPPGPAAPPVEVPSIAPAEVPNRQPITAPPDPLPGAAPLPRPVPMPGAAPQLPQLLPVPQGARQLLPTGLPAAPPTPPPPTPPGTTFLPGGIPLPNNGPPPTPQGTATELGKLERKLDLLHAPDGPLSLRDQINRVIDQVENIKFVLDNLFPPGPYTFGDGFYFIQPVCDRDGDGNLLPPMSASWLGGEGEIVEVNRKLDALALLMQFSKELKQPTCGGSGNGPGSNVTVHFESD